MIINGKQAVYRIHGKQYHCALDVTMGYIGGKWKSVVLWYLRGGTRRFSELKQSIPDITEKMLSIQLRALEADGLVQRTVHGTKPPVKVEYALTDFGKTLLTSLEALAKWGRTLGEQQGELVFLEEEQG